MLLAGATAGCMTIGFGSDDEREYAIGVFNYDETARTFHVRIGERPGEFFHYEVVELAAETADETIPFDGIPASLSVTVDEGTEWDRWEFAWPVQRGGGETADKANIRFWPDGHQAIMVEAGV